VVALAIVAGVLAGDDKKDDKKSADRQQAKTFEKEVTIKVKMKYLLYLPKGYGMRTRPGRWSCSCTAPAKRATT